MYETMLIVDDNELEREMLREMMQTHYTVMEAENGQECLEVVKACQEHIDIILLDLMMPEMDGFAVLERREQIAYFKEIPVIVLTSSGAIEDQVKSFHLGANDFISKPINPDIARLRINNVLTAKRRIMSLIRDSEEYKVRAELDQMTGLYNKATTEAKIDLKLKNEMNMQHALMIVDIDNFKAVNDLHGHEEGDHTIKIISDLLVSQFRNSDIVGRIGGDEFAIFMSEIPSKEIARAKAQELIRIMKYDPNLTLPANVTLSVGLAFSEKKIDNYLDLEKLADDALYCAKNEGKARYVEYGVVHKKLEVDERDTVFLFSRNRNICSMVESIFDENVNYRNIIDSSELKSILRQKDEKMKIIYLDISEQTDEGQAIVAMLNQEAQTDAHIIAFCKEGDMNQYRNVLGCPKVEDLMTVPLDINHLKRRTGRICDFLR